MNANAAPAQGVDANMIREEEIFTGERVSLRLLTEQDAPLLYAFRCENRAFLQPFEPLHRDEQFTLEHMRSTLAGWTSDRLADRSYGFGIFGSDAPGELAGTIRLSGIVRGAFQSAMLGYALAERHNAKGWMTEAVRLVLGIAFQRLELHRVQANAMPRNAGSLRVMEKNGFRREGYSPRYLCINGVWEDHVCCAITAEEFPLAVQAAEPPGAW
ncbi:GNAT family N-acetyltransferase [Paenibacillus chartarius]|uniref:GNAT family N-acetyltransferase n=1 Tax=Paenibacillus chartarius TaxID=747481 RepID=A0ABV6DI75_9BACL